MDNGAIAVHENAQKTDAVQTNKNLLLSRHALVNSTPALEILAVAASAGDSQIRDQVLSRLNAQLWRPSLLNMTDYDGNVDLWSFVTSNDEKKAALPWKE